MTCRRRTAFCSTIPGRAQRLDERQAGAVAAGHLRLIDPQLAVVDLQAGQRGHEVLDHLHAGLAAAERGAPRHFDAVVDGGGDSRAALQVGADEDDARVGRRGPELDAHVAPAPVAHPFDRGGGGYRSLVSCSVHPEVPVIRDKSGRERFSPSGRPSLAGRRATYAPAAIGHPAWPRRAGIDRRGRRIQLARGSCR